MKTLADLNLVYPGREETERLYQEYKPRVAWLHARAAFFEDPDCGRLFNDLITFAKDEPEAQWIKTIFGGRPVYNAGAHYRLFAYALMTDPNNIFALAYAGYHCSVDHRLPSDALERAAKGGHTLAQVKYAWTCGNETLTWHWFVVAAQQDEPLAWFSLSGILSARKQPIHAFVARGASLGQVQCMDAYAEVEFTKQEPEYWRWKVRAASQPGRLQRAFTENLIIIMHDYRKTGCDRNIVYAIGHSLCTVEGTAFCDKYQTDNGYMPGVIESAIQVYKNIDAAARPRVMTWMLVARKVGLYKDVARLIGQIVWAARLDDDDGKDAVAKKRKL